MRIQNALEKLGVSAYADPGQRSGGLSVREKRVIEPLLLGIPAGVTFHLATGVSAEPPLD